MKFIIEKKERVVFCVREGRGECAIMCLLMFSTLLVKNIIFGCVCKNMILCMIRQNTIFVPPVYMGFF